MVVLQTFRLFFLFSSSHYYSLSLYIYIQYDNGDGRIMFTDFVDFIARKMKKKDPALAKSDVMDSFAVFDKEKNGKVNKKELKHVLTKMGEFMDPKEVDSILREAKVDKNGDFKYNDFVKLMQSQYKVFG